MKNLKKKDMKKLKQKYFSYKNIKKNKDKIKIK